MTSGVIESESPVTVTLGGLSTCGGQAVYSDYTIQLVPDAQPGIDWSQAQRGSFACRFSAGNYRPSKRDAEGGCTFFGRNRAAWVPGIPKRWLYTGFCRMQWVGFDNGPTTTGKGVLRSGFTQWGARVTLSHPAWCQEGIGDAIAYTRLTMTIYGKGEPERDEDIITAATANRLRASIGKPGLRARTYRYTQSITDGCVALGSQQAQSARLALASAHVASPVYLDQAGLSDASEPSAFRLPEYHSADLHTLVNALVSAMDSLIHTGDGRSVGSRRSDHRPGQCLNQCGSETPRLDRPGWSAAQNGA
jgi:hypothetical protein